MSDNIIIGVHGKAQTLEGINGINAKEATGGSTNYVPEDTLKVGGKTVTQNGTYNAADDNMLGYKRVVVMDLVSEGPSKTFQDTRKHNAMIACGNRQRIFANVKKLRAKKTNDADYTVAPSPNLRTKSLSVLHPGTYDVSSETDADVYTPVYVSVSDSERDAAGFNPENPTWQDNLPDEIRVTTLPTKTEYSDGEEIDYTGLVVKAYKNGSVWSNENYPNGVIPFDELIINDFIASKMMHVISDVDMPGPVNEVICPFKVFDSTTLSAYRITRSTGYKDKWTYLYTPESGDVIFASFAGDFVETETDWYSEVGNYDALVIPASKDENSKIKEIHRHDSELEEIVPLQNSYTYNDKTVYYIRYGITMAGVYGDESQNVDIRESLDAGTKRYWNYSGRIAWLIIYGTRAVIIQWKRPCDGLVLQTYFPISLEE